NAIEAGDGNPKSARSPEITAATSVRLNQRASAISAGSTRTGWAGSATAVNPSISEPGNGHAWLATYRMSVTVTPTSSATSRTTVASADSPGSTKPARHEYRRTQPGDVHDALWPSRQRPSGPGTPSWTSTITAGSVRAHIVSPSAVVLVQPPSPGAVGCPLRGEYPCRVCQFTSATAVRNTSASRSAS